MAEIASPTVAATEPERVQRTEPDELEDRSARPAARVLDALTVALLPALTIYVGFHAGGYFADTTAWVTAAVAILLAARVAIAPMVPGAPFAFAGAALGLFAIWTLLSGDWSGSWGRALIEFDRVLLYLLLLAAFGSLAQPRRAMAFLPVGLALAAIVLCGAGLWTRVLPGSWPFDLPPANDRLAYPLTYSNGLGCLAALGIIAALHVASWERYTLAIRAGAAAGLPILTATLVLTFSRGAILALAVGLVVWAVIGRPRGLITVLVACVPFIVISGAAAYGADLLASDTPGSPAALDQGNELARTVGLSILGSVLLLVALRPLERRWVTRARLRPSRPLGIALVVAAIVATGVLAVIFVPDAVRSLRADIQGSEPSGEPLTRDRLNSSVLTDIGGQTRVKYWEVSIDAFEREPVTGTGVGTWAVEWARDRPFAESVTEGHSVYVETLGELGIVGVLLLIAVFASLLGAIIANLRRDGRRPLHAAALGLAVAWLIHAGIDWDWEVPALTAWLFAFAGAELAAWPGNESRRLTLSVGLRALAAGLLIMLAATPVTIALSQARLNTSVDALLAGDCDRAEQQARSASSLLSWRAEPYEVISYCASRAGQHGRAIASMREAIDRDPGSWELRYGLALVEAAGGKDPRRAVVTLRRMNPLEPLTGEAVARFLHTKPSRWPQEAATAPLPLP